MNYPETPPNVMNDNTINDDDNNNIRNNEDDDNQSRQTWSTWEELLLACAVKRHGFRDWDSVAMEVQTRSSLPPPLTTATNCKQKYRDLNRRFREQPTNDDNGEDEDEKEKDNNQTERNGEDKVDSIPWLEQLRSLRVAELKRELQRNDVSILSLQLKVKRLEEERDQKPDLGNERSENDRRESRRPKREKPDTGEESDRDNRSVNESNSTGPEEKIEAEPGPVREESVDPDPVRKEEGSVSRRSEVSDSGEFGGESGTRTSGDVESSARKRKRKKMMGGGEIGVVASAPDVIVKLQPLIGLLDVIRAHRHGSLFERRLHSQDLDNYKNVVRQHLDLDMIQTKLNQGSYASSTLSFYRDLLLLFTNAIVFFPKSSPESLAAHQLQAFVLTEMKKESRKSDSNSQNPASPANNTFQAKPELEISDSLLARQRSSAPLIVCRKRSSVSTKPSSSSSFTQKAEQEKKPEQTSKEVEKAATGTRSSRRNKKGTSSIAHGYANTTPTNRKRTGAKTPSSNDDKQETPKTENKKASASDKRKSMADFLRRIKKNSPVKTTSKKDKDQKKNSVNIKNDNKGKKRVLRNTAEKKKTKEENTSISKKTTGRAAKKGPEPAASTVKRGKENGGGRKEKQPKKRARR